MWFIKKYYLPSAQNLDWYDVPLVGALMHFLKTLYISFLQAFFYEGPLNIRDNGEGSSKNPNTGNNQGESSKNSGTVNTNEEDYSKWYGSDSDSDSDSNNFGKDGWYEKLTREIYVSNSYEELVELAKRYEEEHESKSPEDRNPTLYQIQRDMIERAAEDLRVIPNYTQESEAGPSEYEAGPSESKKKEPESKEPEYEGKGKEPDYKGKGKEKE